MASKMASKMATRNFGDSTLTFALQALLARHEAYMADAERDRLDLTSRIERLEIDKHQLEAANANKIEENRQLLDQLEMLNSTVSESDTKIKSLEASLLSSQQTVRRLEAAAARAEDAERHLALMEDEQLKLHSELRLTKEDARSHAQRCKEAQRGILDMQDELERMEKEAKNERERHEEVIGRMERQREVEKQLDTAAGRLKGAAAATKSFGNQGQKSGNAVVSHFVKDLLQDNANLQLGIAELREMLMNSNDEIQTLREQLMYHQPIPQEELSTPSTLKAELGEDGEPEAENAKRLSQELHIHHHYHVAKQEVRKPKKKRQGLTPGVFHPPVTSSPQVGLISSPAGPARLSQPDRERQNSMSPTPVQTWVSYSNPPSEFASSVPSSPRSNRVSSLFDNGFFDSGGPTSPTTSFDPMSPTWRGHSKRPSAASYQSFQSFQTIPPLDMISDAPNATATAPRNYFDSTIHEEDEDATHADEDAPSLVTPGASADESTTESSEFSREDYMPPRPGLHRSLSHESIMSLTGGLDIHTLKSRPSQMTLRPIGGLEAVVTGVTAQPTLSRSSAKRSDAALRDHFIGIHNIRSVSSPVGSDTAYSSSPASTSTSNNTLTGGFGKLVAWRPWGGVSNTNAKAHAGTTLPNSSASASASALAATLASTSASTSTSTSKVATPVAASTPKQTSTSASSKHLDRGWNRTPGINQPGSIPGFQQYWAMQRRKGAPARVNAEAIDRDALSEGLQE